MGTLLTNELRKSIGYETSPTTIVIDRTFLDRFVNGIEDVNPRWTDTAPPSIFNASLMLGEKPFVTFAEIFPPRALDGGSDTEIYQDVKLGDTITVTGRLADMVERQGRLGAMLIVTTELIWRNQRQEMVARAVHSMIGY